MGFAAGFIGGFGLERRMEDAEFRGNGEARVPDDLLEIPAPGDFQMGAQGDEAGRDRPNVQIMDIDDPRDPG